MCGKGIVEIRENLMLILGYISKMLRRYLDS